MVQFDATVVKPLLASFVAHTPEELVEMGRHRIGSHALESFLTSEATSKRHDRVLSAFVGRYAQLAMDRAGSHVRGVWQARGERG